MKEKLIMLSLLLGLATTPIVAQEWNTFTHEHFVFKILGMEKAGEGIKITLLYTNLQETSQNAAIHNTVNGARNITQNYLIDDLGFRYGYKSGESIDHVNTYPPGIPVRMSLTFGDFNWSVSKFMFSIYWSYYSGSGWQHMAVIFRDIPTRAD